MVTICENKLFSASFNSQRSIQFNLPITSLRPKRTSSVLGRYATKRFHRRSPPEPGPTTSPDSDTPNRPRRSPGDRRGRVQCTSCCSVRLEGEEMER